MWIPLRRGKPYQAAGDDPADQAGQRKDLATLKEWLKIAIHAEPPEQFRKESNLM